MGVVFAFLEEFDMSSNNPNKDFRCDIDDSEWEFTKPYTSIVTEVGPTSSHFESSRRKISNKSPW